MRHEHIHTYMYHLHTSLSSYFLTEAPTCLSVDIIFFDSENGRNTKKKLKDKKETTLNTS